jgi:hypothetical protein
MVSQRRGLLVSSALALGVLACVVHLAAQGWTRDLRGQADVLDLERFQVVTSEGAVSRAAS